MNHPRWAGGTEKINIEKSLENTELRGGAEKEKGYFI